MNKIHRPHYLRYFEAVNLLKSDPILQNTHKFYEMTREEQWYQSMAKLRRVYELDRNKWIHEHEPGNI